MSGTPKDDAPRASAVALVGFMASGTSAVGRLVAKRLRVPFIDTDALIEAREGPIAEIFAARGELVFRGIERDVVVEVLERARREPCIVALGGGAVLSGDVGEALRRLPHIAWLTAPAEVLWARAAARRGRPLAKDQQAFDRLYEERNDLYRRVASAVVLNDGSRALTAVADEIVALTADREPDAAPGGGEGRG